MDEPKLIKKKSFTERIIGKKGIFISIAIVLVVTLLIGSSYSLLTSFETPNNAIIIREGDMRMTVNNTEGQIKLKNRSYVSDKEGLKKDKKVALVGFGTFAVSKRAARDGRNPRTGETVHIAARKAVSFKAGSALKEAVNK